MFSECIYGCTCVVHVGFCLVKLEIFIKYYYTRCYVRKEVNDVQIFGHQHEEKLKCPYKGCEKAFDKPTVITDTSVLPRQTHYACPYCMSKLNLIMDKEKILEIKPTEYSTVLDSPAKCAIFSGLLQPGQQILTMDECLICPKVLQCTIRKK
jgi:hypothetical protein